MRRIFSWHPFPLPRPLCCVLLDRRVGDVEKFVVASRAIQVELEETIIDGESG